MYALTGTKTEPIRAMCRAAEIMLRHGARADIATEDWTPLHTLSSWRLTWQKPGASPEIGQVVRKLSGGDAPTVILSGIVRGPAGSAETLYNLWGFRMREFLETMAETLQQHPDQVDDYTAPLVWTRRGDWIVLERATTERLISMSRRSAE